MDNKEFKILLDLISEYELRAKYNNDTRDYETYSVLIKAKEIVLQHMMEKKEDE